MAGGLLSRVLVEAALAVPQRGIVLVAGRYLAGAPGRRFIARSEEKGDDWQVEEAVVFGTGAPTEYELHTDAKYNFLFRPLGSMRPIGQGEEFIGIG